MQLVTLDELTRLATDFAETLRGGEVVLLEGELGAGKTTFVQAVCRALGVQDTVTSPTFAMMNVYEVRRDEGSQPARPNGRSGGVWRVMHLDLYRLKSARELAALGLEEYLAQSDTLTFIEWPDAVEGVRWNATHRIQLTVTNALERSLDIQTLKQ